jgi:hypothetical protein
MHELIDIPLDALQSHLASGDARYPILICISVAVAGLILMARGARLTPFLAATVLTVIGWFIGAASASATGLPYWPSTMVGGAIGLVLGVVLVRFWVALLLAGVFAGIGLTVYAVNVLPPHLEQYAEGQTIEEFTLPGSEAAATSPGFFDGGRWQYLVDHVPNLQVSLVAIAASTGLAGLVLGLLLPWLSRAMVAATAGTIGFVIGLYALVHLVGWGEHLNQVADWYLTGLGTIWLLSLVANLFDGRSSRRQPAPAPNPAPATAPQQAPATT